MFWPWKVPPAQSLDSPYVVRRNRATSAQPATVVVIQVIVIVEIMKGTPIIDMYCKVCTVMPKYSVTETSRPRLPLVLC